MLSRRFDCGLRLDQSSTMRRRNWLEKSQKGEKYAMSDAHEHVLHPYIRDVNSRELFYSTRREDSCAPRAMSLVGGKYCSRTSSLRGFLFIATAGPRGVVLYLSAMHLRVVRASQPRMAPANWPADSQRERKRIQRPIQSTPRVNRTSERSGS
ncbi:uncharacterized protein EI90DRAFT_3077856 [Cantharellus anzutake]|uniref:uncharacterized protein n=1 Tax=Cantharellus anzutake TaxID=1750568 RepID=UPI0019043B1B|nr:uncharacterized protein EI90DRAFT_3077856 [Cantharellus anzutake]KAF8322814.1 hypothetical protein EI90DRAFT_3077856 [Cantharellus anzutake]